MMGMNRVFILGRLGRDPQHFQDKSGKPYVRLSLATERRWITDGEPERKTDWHTVMVWGKKGELCLQYLKKGLPIMVEGSLSTYEISDESGQKRWSTSVHASRVEFLSNRNSEPPARGEVAHDPSTDSEEVKVDSDRDFDLRRDRTLN